MSGEYIPFDTTKVQDDPEEERTDIPAREGNFSKKLANFSSPLAETGAEVEQPFAHVVTEENGTQGGKISRFSRFSRDPSGRVTFPPLTREECVALRSMICAQCKTYSIMRLMAGPECFRCGADPGGWMYE
jgi:hypothetical protein